MAYPTFVPPAPVNPGPGSSIQVKPRVLTAGFGDGYAQRTGDGLNAIARQFSVTITNITWDELRTVEAFLDERAGYQPFMWTLPHETTPRQWLATDWKPTYSGKNTADLSITLQENFDP